MSHHNTVFSQILKWVPRHEFGSLAKTIDGARRSDGMSRWTQFVGMATAQLSGRSSLRDFAHDLPTSEQESTFRT